MHARISASELIMLCPLPGSTLSCTAQPADCRADTDLQQDSGRTAGCQDEVSTQLGNYQVLGDLRQA